MKKSILTILFFFPFITFAQFNDSKVYLNAGFSFLKTKSEIKFQNSSSSNPDPVVSKGQFTLSVLPGLFINEHTVVGISLSTSNLVRYENSIELKTRPNNAGIYYKKFNMFNDIIGLQMRAGINALFGNNEYLQNSNEILKSKLSGFNIDLKGGAIIKLGNKVLFELTMPVIQFIKLSESTDTIKYTDTTFTTALNSNGFSPYEIGFTFVF